MPLALDTRKTLQRGLLLVDEGNASEGEALLAEVANSHSESGPARLFHGIALWERGDYSGAEEEFRATQKLSPGNTLALSYLGLALAAQGRADEARACWASYGHHANRMYRVRVTEWVEEGFLRANGWPNLVPAPGARTSETGSSSSQDEPDSLSDWADIPNEGAIVEPPPAWNMGILAPRQPLPPEFLGSNPQRLGMFRRSGLERQVSRQFRDRRFEEVCRSIPPLLADPRCDMTTLWAGATAAELTGHPAEALALCERVIPQTEWPDLLRALYARCLYRLGRHAEAAEALTPIQVRGPEDYGVHWILGSLALAQQDRPLARRLFARSHGSYMVDTIETQWWSVEQALNRWSGEQDDHKI